VRFARALQPLAPTVIRVAFREGDFRPPPQRSPPMVSNSPYGRPIPVRRFAIAARLPDGRWLNAQFALPRPHAATGVLFLSAGFTALALVCASLWMGFRFAGPLRRLAEASASLRPGEPISEVAEQGPNALKDVIRAFNAMSKRLMSTLEGQRSMLAAIAHDLRTPITSLRLRLELLDDGETKERMQAALDELQDTAEAAVDALKAEGAGESTRAMDVGALIESLCTDLSDLGQEIEFVSTGPISCRCRPHEIRRAVRNLIENAVRYGGRARVRLERRGNDVLVTIDDDGPGIPPADLEQVFAPFRRLEESRSRETGGHGLGLTIARAIARGHGGDILLENRPGGGLTAKMWFPQR
jgi:signal transduction histidine kinase